MTINSTLLMIVLRIFFVILELTHRWVQLMWLINHQTLLLSEAAEVGCTVPQE